MARTVYFTRTISRIARSVQLSAALCVAAYLASQSAWAQTTGGGGNTIGGGATSGVAVDADGVLRRVMKDDPTGELSRQRIQEALTRARSQRRSTQPTCAKFRSRGSSAS